MSILQNCSKAGDCELVIQLAKDLEQAIRVLRKIRMHAESVPLSACRTIVPAGTSLDKSMVEIKRIFTQQRIDLEVRLPEDKYINAKEKN